MRPLRILFCRQPCGRARAFRRPPQKLQYGLQQRCRRAGREPRFPRQAFRRPVRACRSKLYLRRHCGMRIQSPSIFRQCRSERLFYGGGAFQQSRYRTTHQGLSPRFLRGGLEGLPRANSCRPKLSV